MHRTRKLTTLAAALGLAILGAGCAQNNKQTASADAAKGRDQTVRAAEMGADVKEAIAVIHGTRGNQKVNGTVKFSEAQGAGGAKGVNVVAHIEGLTPNGTHGFHIHEFGDCSAPDATSAGGHYNPGGHQHGSPGENSHVGDMGNLKANAQGVAHLELNLPHATIAGKNAILGRGVIVHAKADDLKTQPTGDAGGRIGCGVIGAAQKK
jgi:Cu-Zn family superoxide dismutase